MKLTVQSGRLPTGDVFRLIAASYAVGVLVLFAPVLLLVAVAVQFGAPFQGDKAAILLFPVMLPLIAVMQTVMFGGICVLGYVLYVRKRLNVEVNKSAGTL